MLHCRYSLRTSSLRVPGNGLRRVFSPSKVGGVISGSMASIRLMSTVSEEEIRKFGAVGEEWWKSSSKAGTGPLHNMNPARIQFIREQVASTIGRSHLSPLEQLAGLTILDVGCGGGLLAEPLARLGAKVTAIDPSTENIAIAKAHSASDPLTAHIDYRSSTVENLVANKESFDVVVSLEVIEHVENPLQFVRHCAACVKQGGTNAGSLILSTLNRTPKSYALGIVGAEHITGVVPVGTHSWSKFIRPDELTKMLTSITMNTTSNDDTHTSNGTDSVSRVRVEDITLNGLVMQPPRNLLQLITNGIRIDDLPWELSERDLDMNYIMHVKLK